jgi:hypothetical protein
MLIVSGGNIYGGFSIYRKNVSPYLKDGEEINEK